MFSFNIFSIFSWAERIFSLYAHIFSAHSDNDDDDDDVVNILHAKWEREKHVKNAAFQQLFQFQTEFHILFKSMLLIRFHFMSCLMFI